MNKTKLISVFLAVSTLSVVMPAANGAVKGVVQLSEEGRGFVYFNTKGRQLLGELLKQCDGSMSSGTSVEIQSKCISRYWILGQNNETVSDVKEIRIENLPDVEQDFDYVQVLNRVVRLYKPSPSISIFDRSWNTTSSQENKKKSDKVINSSSFLHEYDDLTWSLAGEILPSSETDFLTLKAGGSYIRLPFNEVERSIRLKFRKENKIEGNIPKEKIVAMWTIGE